MSSGNDSDLEGLQKARCIGGWTYRLAQLCWRGHLWPSASEYCLPSAQSKHYWSRPVFHNPVMFDTELYFNCIMQTWFCVTAVCTILLFRPSWGESLWVAKCLSWCRVFVSSPSPATLSTSGSSVDKWVLWCHNDVVSHVTSSHTIVHSSIHVGLSLG